MENDSALVYAYCQRQAKRKCRFLKEKILSVSESKNNLNTNL